MKPIIADNLTGYIHKIFWLRLNVMLNVNDRSLTCRYESKSRNHVNPEEFKNLVSFLFTSWKMKMEKCENIV